jgi:MFS family permease
MAPGLAKRKVFGIEADERLCNRVAAAVFFFMLGVGFSCWASRIPDIKSAHELSDKAFGTILLMLPAGQFTAMFLSSWLVGKFGSRNVLTLGFLAYPSALMLVGYVGELWQLYGALFLFGAGGNLCNISVNTQAVGVEKIYKRSIMGFFHGMWSLAGFVGGLLSLLIVGMGLSVLEHFALMLVLCILALVFVRPFLLAKDFKNPPVDKPKSRLPRLDKYIVLLGFIAFCCMATEGTMFDWSIIYFEDVVNAPENQIRFGFIAFMSMMALGRFTSDHLVMKMGSIRVLKLSGTLIAFGLAVAVLFPGIVVSSLGFAFVGLGVSSIVPLCYSLAGRSRTLNAGTAIAGVSSIGFFGFLFGPPIIGYISDASSLRLSFSVIAVVGFMVVILAPRLKTPEIADE